MNSIWNKNLVNFSKRFTKLYKIIQNEFTNELKFFEQINEKVNSPDDFADSKNYFENFKITLAKNGEITASEKNLNLHSTYNPSKEAQNAVKQSSICEKNTIVFYGFGLGYHAISVCELYPEKKLVLIENDIFHFFVSISLVDWEKIFLHKNLILALNCPPENIISLIEDSTKINFENEGVSDSFFFDLKPFTFHCESYFEIIRKIVKRNVIKNQMNSSTLDKFSSLWTRNSLKNAYELSKKEGIQKFRNCVKDSKIPFAIIGAGPSLQKIEPYFCEIQKRFVTIAVETSLPFLLKHKIQPDFIILCDPQYWAYRHIAGLHFPSSVLITEIDVYPKTFDFDCREILLCSSQFSLAKYLEKKSSFKSESLGNGGSVATAAWTFAKYCGAKEIYLLGVDLSFPDKLTHVKGSSSEQKIHNVSNRIETSEKLLNLPLFEKSVLKGLDYENHEILTDTKMKMFAWWFESKISGENQSSTFTLCKKTLKIPGIQVSKIEDVLKKNEIQKKFINDLLNSREDKKEQNKKFILAKNEFNSNVKKVRFLCKKILSEKNLEKIREIEKEIFQNEICDIVKMLIPSEKKQKSELLKESLSENEQKLASKTLIYKNILKNLKELN